MLLRDKNPTKLAECTEYFAKIQAAYEVLSDDHERAFYDRHRESILRGQESGSERESEINLYSFMSTSIYKGYGDDSKSFYSVYAKLFDDIAGEDYSSIENVAEWNYPKFGNSTSDYDTIVAPFYDFWLVFSTKKSYAWLDQYDIMQADNRAIARQIEKENKKYRDAGKRTRNEHVRELALFVRRRDKRFDARRIELETRRKEQELKAKLKQKEQIKANLEAAAKYKENTIVDEMYKVQLDKLEEIVDNEHDCGKSVDEYEDEELYCVVCEKEFKSPKALENHKNSKKHRQILEELKKHMKDEDKELFKDVVHIKNNPHPEENFEEGHEEIVSDDGSLERLASIDETVKGKSKKDKKKEKKKLVLVASSDVEDDDLLSGFVGDKLSVPTKSEEKLPEVKKRRRRKDVAPAKVEEPSNICAICQESFESKTQLFKHVREEGHAGPKTANITSKSKKNKNDF
uniref:C2H2-type domain-containing protein n=1 Tax=Rhabditophanes sp. KR3021 TaxID=114890 RepID=A0AC35TV07_9BILA